MDSLIGAPQDVHVVSEREAPEVGEGLRLPGLVVLIGIVLVGLGSGAAYFHYKQPKLAAELQARVDAIPRTPAGRLAAWHEFGGPQIHHRLSKFARFTPELPWLVTHAVRDPAGGDPELWGIDCDALPRELSHLEDLTVVIELPAPRALGRRPLEGDMVRHVPLVAEGAGFDASERLRELGLFLLEGLPAALEKEIPGASIQLRISENG